MLLQMCQYPHPAFADEECESTVSRSGAPRPAGGLCLINMRRKSACLVRIFYDSGHRLDHNPGGMVLTTDGTFIGFPFINE